MFESSRSVSLRELISSGTSIQPHEAVTIVQQVCGYLAGKSSVGEPIGVPPLEEIRIDAAGEAAITDLSAVNSPASVEDLGRLLEALLPPPGRDYRRLVPGPLRFAVARALGEVDARPYASVAEFSATLARFERDAPRQAIGALFDRWREEHARSTPRAVLVDGKWAVDAFGFRERRASETGVPTRPAPIRTERRRVPKVDAFRMMLREVDQRAFESNGPGAMPNPVLTASDEARRPVLERRAAHADLATFRRMLREADRALYERRAAVEGPTIAEPAGEPEGVSLPVAVRTGEVVAESRVVALEPVVKRLRRPQVAPDSRWLAAAAILVLALAIPFMWQPGHESPPAGASGDVVSDSARQPSRGSDAGAMLEPPRGGAPGRGRATSDTADSEAAHLVLASHDEDPARSLPSFSSHGFAVSFADAASASGARRSPRDGAVLYVTSIEDDGARNYHVRVSPDGRSITFDSDRDGVRGVYVATRQGKDVRRVSGPGFAALPAWSPDASRLAIVRGERENPEIWNLWLLDLDNRTERRLTSHKSGQPWGASWFPDGRRICYGLDDTLYILDIDSGRTARHQCPARACVARMPAVSPDARRVVFQVVNDGVWLLNLADGSMRRILSDQTAEAFTWAPDGRRLAFHSPRTGGWGLWVPGT